MSRQSRETKKKKTENFHLMKIVMVFSQAIIFHLFDLISLVLWLCIFLLGRQCTYLWYFLTEALWYDADADVAMWTCESPFLRLDRHHKAYELSVYLQFCAKWFQEQGNKTSKRMKKSEWWCMIDNYIDDCDFERIASWAFLR
jgi:hypothetical protein